MNYHVTFAVAALTVVLIIIAEELIHPAAGLLLAFGGTIFAASKLNLFARD